MLHSLQANATLITTYATLITTYATLITSQVFQTHLNFLCLH